MAERERETPNSHRAQHTSQDMHSLSLCVSVSSGHSIGGVMGRTSQRKLSLAQFCKNRCVEQLTMCSHFFIENGLELTRRATHLFCIPKRR